MIRLESRRAIQHDDAPRLRQACQHPPDDAPAGGGGLPRAQQCHQPRRRRGRCAHGDLLVGLCCGLYCRTLRAARHPVERQPAGEAPQMQHDPHPAEASETRRRPGPVALVGSGEYTPAMDETDRHLLALIGGPERARVALLPTASGLEPSRPAYWNDLGLAHFRALGVADVRATTILDAAGARDPAQLALLRDATFFYLSGGDPVHLIASLRDSPAWEIIARAHA